MYKFHDPKPNNIIFFNTLNDKHVEVLRISKDGITANPEIPVDEAADAVIRALDSHIKALTQRTWVGLTDEEAIFLIENDGIGRGELIESVEAKLKEKNHAL